MGTFYWSCNNLISSHQLESLFSFVLFSHHILCSTLRCWFEEGRYINYDRDLYRINWDTQILPFYPVQSLKIRRYLEQKQLDYVNFMSVMSLGRALVFNLKRVGFFPVICPLFKLL